MPPFGVMFHHFHDEPDKAAAARHPRGQGSISATTLSEMLDDLGDRVIPAREYAERAAAGQLTDTDVCLTFDDNLRCQFDVAEPVLKERGLTGSWFVATGTLRGEAPKLEIYRRFRDTRFANIDDFYEAYFRLLAATPLAERVCEALRTFDPNGYLAEFAFYSEADRRFRYVRDEVLGPRDYERVMDELIAAHGVSITDLARDLWMGETELRRLHKEGHVIGLHSHSHPTRLANLTPSQQRAEYADNLALLMDVTRERPTTMSHPCNSYTDATLAILRDLGVTVGFRANMAPGGGSTLELPREDHVNLLSAAAVN
ncbi:MAG: polysaccharide deacetylase family protein [Phycisphaerales bacterium]|nr:polysaccharide deacetylase family protein [Phycisphaerales bacterium]